MPLLLPILPPFANGKRRVRVRRRLVVEQDAVSGAVEILELARPQRPQEGAEPYRSEQERGWNKEQKTVHDMVLARPRRKALPITTMDELDMAMAATSGVTSPAAASGTVKIL